MPMLKTSICGVELKVYTFTVRSTMLLAKEMALEPKSTDKVNYLGGHDGRWSQI